MDKGHSLQNLFHIAFYVFDWNPAAVFAQTSITTMRLPQLLDALLGVLDDLLKILVTVLEYQVLRRFSIIGTGVIYIEHPNDIFAVFELVEDFEFSGDVLARLLGAFNGDSLLRVLIISFKYVSK